MAVKFFGQFLVEKGVVSREHVVEAMRLQEEVNLKFGETAVSMELLTQREIERIHLAQRREDLRFGDMALKLGILTEEQHQQVLARQKEKHVYIGEALVKVGALEAGELERYLREFREDQAPYRVEHITIPSGVEPADVWEIFADFTYKMFTRIAHVAFRPGRCEKIERLNPGFLTVAMPLVGDVSGTYYLSVSAGVRDRIARGLLNQEDLTGESPELLADTVMEFANIVCGNVSAKATQIGFAIEIEPPEVIDAPGGLPVPEGYHGIVFPIHIADEAAEIVILCSTEPEVSESGYDMKAEGSGVFP